MNKDDQKELFIAAINFTAAKLSAAGFNTPSAATDPKRIDDLWNRIEKLYLTKPNGIFSLLADHDPELVESYRLLLSSVPSQHSLVDEINQIISGKNKTDAARIRLVREAIERVLWVMMAQNSQRSDLFRKYIGICGADKRSGNSAATTPDLAQLIAFANEIEEERLRAGKEGLTEDELAIFDLMWSEEDGECQDYERIKQGSRILVPFLKNMAFDQSDSSGGMDDLVKIIGAVFAIFSYNDKWDKILPVTAENIYLHYRRSYA